MGRRAVWGFVERTSCCGLYEFHELDNEGSWDGNKQEAREAKRNNPGRAIYATTVASQRAEIAGLKAARFRKVGTWRNSNTGRNVTLWVYIPGFKKKRKP